MFLIDNYEEQMLKSSQPKITNIQQLKLFIMS